MRGDEGHARLTLGLREEQVGDGDRAEGDGVLLRVRVRARVRVRVVRRGLRLGRVPLEDEDADGRLVRG